MRKTYLRKSNQILNWFLRNSFFAMPEFTLVDNRKFKTWSSNYHLSSKTKPAADYYPIDSTVGKLILWKQASDHECDHGKSVRPLFSFLRSISAFLNLSYMSVFENVSLRTFWLNKMGSMVIINALVSHNCVFPAFCYSLNLVNFDGWRMLVQRQFNLAQNYKRDLLVWLHLEDYL